MEKNKIKNITLFILLFIYFASNIMIREVGNLDELWNYTFANNIANGLLPYQDFNMVVTPLLSFISSVFLIVFGKELIVIRILNIILSSLIIYMIYKIMNMLKIKQYISLILLIFITFVYSHFAMFDYNFAISLVTLIIMYLEIKGNPKGKKKHEIGIGILAGVCILLKQSTGLIITLATLGYKILEIRNKQQFKQYLKVLLLRTTGAIIPVVLLLIYLITNNIFSEFLDYCIFGITTFSNHISYTSVLFGNVHILLKICMILPTFLLILIPIYIKQKDKNALILLIFGIITLSVVYPIADGTHVISGIFITIIATGYILDKILIQEMKYISKICYIFIITFTIITAISGINKYVKSNKNTELAHYTGLIMEQTEVQRIKEVSQFIKQNSQTVYILDSTATYYMIPINKYNKNYDMFNLGNLGSEGEEGQIENLKKEQGTIQILLPIDESESNWQEPTKVTNWVKQNMKKAGQIVSFDIYK